MAWVSLGVGVTCAAVIAFDITVGRRHQAMGVMNVVFPVTALYFGPVALAFYVRRARAAPRGRGGRGSTTRPGPSRWGEMATEVSHCGAGCTLGDIVSEVVVFALALTIAGHTILAEYAGDYLLAVALGIVFQYFAIAPMRGLGLRDGLAAAAKADIVSLTAFEVGLFAWMAIMTFVLFAAHPLMPNSAAFWFLMQIGMIIGFFTSWPANVWLVRRGIKTPMTM